MEYMYYDISTELNVACIILSFVPSKITKMLFRYVQSVKKENRTTCINSHTIDRRKMKFVPVSMDYCVLQFDALNFFLWSIYMANL